jgi:tetratricopeptide (TPR) repeat protein
MLQWKLRSYDWVIADATACLRLGVQAAQMYRLRGLAWMLKGDPDQTLADLDESLRLQPGEPSALMGRVWARQKKGNLAGALEDAETALKSAPDDVSIFPVLAHLHYRCRNWTRMRTTLQMWAARAPADPRPHGNLADVYATCPDATVRDGKQAVECARRACELSQWTNPNALDSLAAACAEAGDFGGAIHWEKRALENDSFASRHGTAARNKLRLYESGQPFHEQ